MTDRSLGGAIMQMLAADRDARAEYKRRRMRAHPLTLAELHPGQRNLLRQLASRGLPALDSSCQAAGCSVRHALVLEEMGLVATYSGETLTDVVKIGIRTTGLTLVREGSVPPDQLYPD